MTLFDYIVGTLVPTVGNSLLKTLSTLNLTAVRRYLAPDGWPRTPDPSAHAARRGRHIPNARASVTNGTEGVTVSGADALLVIGLVALALACGAFVIVVCAGSPARGGRGRRRPARRRPADRAGAGRGGARSGPARRPTRTGFSAGPPRRPSRRRSRPRRAAARSRTRSAPSRTRSASSAATWSGASSGSASGSSGSTSESRRLEARGQALEQRRTELEERAKALTEADAKARAGA